jgi:aldose 1-epimerase
VRWVEGGTIETVEIANGPFRAQFLTLGAALRVLEVPGRDGTSANIVLGYQDLEEYRGDPRFYGAVAGRYANRIGGAKFSLDGQEYALARNDGANSLHSGPRGFDQVFWELAAHDARSATFATFSYAGTNGFPGTLYAEIRYTMEADGLAIAFSATTDAPTVVNLTHHAYFNLAGEGSGESILGHQLQIPASRYTPVDEALIPTGALAPVADTPFDFRAPKPMGRDFGRDDVQLARAHGYDHNFVLDGPAGGIHRAATVYDSGSGRVLEIHSTEPGVQFYSGNWLAGGPPGTSGHIYAAHEGLCLEPQKFPDSPNQPHFPSARLDPGQRYAHNMAFRFRTAGDEDEAFST